MAIEGGTQHLEGLGVAHPLLLLEVLLGLLQDCVVINANIEIFQNPVDSLPPMLRLRLELRVDLILQLIVLDHRVVKQRRDVVERVRALILRQGEPGLCSWTYYESRERVVVF